MQHLMNTYGRLPVSIARGEGPWVWDTEGRRYLDALTGIAVTGLGHAHPRVVAAIAVDEARDKALRAIDARHLFAPNLTRLAIRRGSYLRRYVYDFIETFASPLTPAVVQAAMNGE